MAHEVKLNDSKHVYNRNRRTIHMPVQDLLGATYKTLDYHINVTNPATGNTVQFTKVVKAGLYTLYNAVYSADNKEYRLVVWVNEATLYGLYKPYVEYERTLEVIQENR